MHGEASQAPASPTHWRALKIPTRSHRRRENKRDEDEPELRGSLRVLVATSTNEDASDSSLSIGKSQASTNSKSWAIVRTVHGLER